MTQCILNSHTEYHWIQTNINLAEAIQHKIWNKKLKFRDMFEDGWNFEQQQRKELDITLLYIALNNIGPDQINPLVNTNGAMSIHQQKQEQNKARAWERSWCESWYPQSRLSDMHEKNERVFPSRLQNAVNRDHTKQLLLVLEIFACWTDVKLDTSLCSKATRLFK